MFDDKPVSNPGQIPPNLPIGEPDDMFAGTEQSLPETPATPSVPSTPSVPQSDEPNFLPPTALEAGILKPKASADPLLPSTISPTPTRHFEPSQIPPATYPNSAPAVDDTMHNSDMMKEPFGGRKVVSLVVTIMVILIIGGGSAWVYFSFIRKSESTPFAAPESAPVTAPVVPPTTPSPAVPVPTPVDPNTNGASGGTTSSVDSRILFGESNLDTDGDGLTDDQERKLGTNYLKWDTDGDSLSDGDETATWKTNPLNLDTDGDSYPDGQEIKNGYNPKGSGKLFNPGVASSTSTVTSTK